MRALLAFIALCSISAACLAQEADNQAALRRCAFLGTWGSFHLIGDSGTAAYIFADGEFIAELQDEGDQPNWWVYRQLPSATADNRITRWAFARQPDICGRYWVLHESGGVWRQYESTYFWGQTRLGSGGGPGLSQQPPDRTAVTVLNSTSRDLTDIFVTYLDTQGIRRSSNLFTIPKGGKQEIRNLPGEPGKLTETNLAIAVRSSDGRLSKGVQSGIPLTELVYHRCDDGVVAVGIVIQDQE